MKAAVSTLVVEKKQIDRGMDAWGNNLVRKEEADEEDLGAAQQQDGQSLEVDLRGASHSFVLSLPASAARGRSRRTNQADEGTGH
jgi:hypothetical protein